MLYIASKLFDEAMRPSAILLIIAVAGYLLTLRQPQARLGQRLLAGGLGGLIGFVVLPLDTWMLRPLEDRFSAPDPMPARVDGIIVLGGSISVRLSADRHKPILNAQPGRMTDFVALARRYPNARLLFSGGNSDPFAAKKTQAEIAKTFFDAIGLGDRHVLYEDRSRNTRENALYSRQLAQPRPGEIWLLLTGAADMPRAVGSFRAVGWKVLAYPTDYLTARHQDGWMPGLARALPNADWATHEWIGLIYYRLRGWSPELLPRP